MKDERTGKDLEEVLQEISRHQKIEELLKRASQEWRATFDSTKELIMTVGADGTILRVNLPTIDFFKVNFEHILDRPWGEFLASREMPDELLRFDDVRKTGIRREAEIFVESRDMWLLASADPIRDDGGAVSGCVFIFRDITGLKKAEQERNEMHSQLLQVQKMDSIGRLAGGVAHDFNNMLSAILAYGEFAYMKLDLSHPAREHIRIVLSAAEKAAALTRQLLAFSRKQVLEKKVLNLSTSVENMGKMLGRIIRENVKLEVDDAGSDANTLADPGNIEQIILNLVVNARDAMPDGGTLTVRTFVADLAEGDPPPVKGMPPGAYAALSVSDTGTGIPPEVQEKIFEPFFTTKEEGKGTGLGLSTVYGIVAQHSGHIAIDSEPDRGTTFTVYLPVTVEKPEEGVSEEEASQLGGSETVLVVDDEESIQGLVAQALRPLGYTVLTASSGKEALQIIGEGTEPSVHLLLADVMMPGMTGKELAESFVERRPEAKVLLMSGYSSDTLEGYLGAAGSEVGFLEKPLTPRQLARTVRSTLDGER